MSEDGTKETKRIVDAEFVDIDGTEKGGKRVLERVADLADHVGNTLDDFGARRGAVKVKQAASVARDVDGIIEEARPLARKVEDAIEKGLKIVGLEEFSERGVMKR